MSGVVCKDNARAERISIVTTVLQKGIKMMDAVRG